MDIRKFQNNDKYALIKLWKTVFSNDSSHNDPRSVIEAKLAVDDLIFVAVDEEEIVGACMAGYDGHRGWLYAVAVLNEYRRKGIGTRLVNCAMETLKKLGCIKVNLQIRSTNIEVTSFYKSLGFLVEERLSMGAFIEQNA